MKSWTMSRRTMLRGLGVAIALPMLDAMARRRRAGRRRTALQAAAHAGAHAADEPALRHLPRGVGRGRPGRARSASSSRCSSRCSRFTGDMLLLGNLMNKAATVDGLAHYTNEANLWTSTVVKKTTGADLDVGGVSVDQVAGLCTGAVTRFPSLHLGMMAPYGGVDSGWARVYNSQLSWSAPTTPVPNEIDPKRAFDRLFRAPAPPVGRKAAPAPASSCRSPSRTSAASSTTCWTTPPACAAAPA